MRRMRRQSGEQYADVNDKFEGKWYVEADGRYNRIVTVSDRRT